VITNPNICTRAINGECSTACGDYEDCFPSHLIGLAEAIDDDYCIKEEVLNET
jgi:hypothetical protein